LNDERRIGALVVLLGFPLAAWGNAEIVGMLAVTAAVARYAGVRWAGKFNALLGGWLIVSALLMPRVGMTTFWNHVAVGFCFVLFGLTSSLRHLRRHTPVRP
jgi:hypothetical protein